ncbi:MAG: hypothetical protein HKN91_15345 [Acidimicrobiia bacterium]|nr:hypothetical protein [Acidimicrobiia bacterium]
MITRRILILPVLFAMAVSVLSTIPVLANTAPAATTGIDDSSGDSDAPGVNVIRRVDAKGTVIVRLNKGDRQAHFDIIVRGVGVVEIGDQFRRYKGLETGFDDGKWGGCRDELATAPFPTGTEPDEGELVGQAKFYTCKQHDSIRLHLDMDSLDFGDGVPSIKILFTEAVLGNVDGVFVGNDLTDVGDSWIPLFTDG